MPWSPKEATGHTKKANTPGRKAQWSSIANAIKQKGMSDASAIRIANSQVAKTFAGKS